MNESERLSLVEKLHQKGITDKAVLQALNNVERHLFVPTAMQHHAYSDVALPIGYGQTISQPYTVAFMTQSLELNPEDKVLEIGTGSGYQAAILYSMGMKVYSIERQFDIYLRTQKLFDKMEIRAIIRYGDGTIGWEEYSPFNGIIVTAGSPKIPPSLKKQLAVGGRLVIPVGDKNSQSLKIIKKIDENEFEESEIPQFTFVPLIGREGWNQK
ncbi:MAG: protein-L-isoaspartate(D-aspartate) O-methyltransferase [Ignavibacteria bacterium]|nr:protein-L-isoaspartate(D-aspartate) O-methyltransferase [Ignavibacteria bacterium]